MVTLERARARHVDQRAGARHVDHVLFPLTGEEVDWPLAGVRFRGRFLFLRRSEEGEVLRLHHDGIACID